MAAKRTTSVSYTLVKAPMSMDCSEPGCYHFVVAGVRVVCIVTKHRFSWQKPDRAYKCVKCSNRFMIRIAKHKQQVAKKRQARTKV